MRVPEFECINFWVLEEWRRVFGVEGSNDMQQELSKMLEKT